jgi:hypothetical protein
MKFKDYLRLITDDTGFMPLPRIRAVIRRNKRKTAREEAIAAEVLRQANPRENISGHYPWGPEEQWHLQQLWINVTTEEVEWRDVLPSGVKHLYSIEETEYGDLPVPNSIREPGVVVMDDLRDKIREAMGDDAE